ncbi:MAG: 1,2-phenylacetyl-CoA epoxidase subunit PaaC [Chitinophagales bacterium]
MTALISYIIHLADNALILGHRNSEWTGHGPILEQDIALSNIALDLIGQSRNLYQLAASLMNAFSARNESGAQEQHSPYREKKLFTEDDLAYLRDSPEFKNAVLLEQTNGDWAKTILRQFYFSHFQLLQYGALLNSREPMLAAISEKSIKETRYHVKWSSEWVCRLGDGTTESHERMLNAMKDLNPWVSEFFVAADYEKAVTASGEGVDPATLYKPWLQEVNKILETASLLPFPDGTEVPVLSGKNGFHSEHLGYILTELQFLQRAYPGCEW